MTKEEGPTFNIILVKFVPYTAWFVFAKLDGVRTETSLVVT